MTSDVTGLITISALTCFSYFRFKRKQNETDDKYNERIAKIKKTDLRGEKIIYAIGATLFFLVIACRLHFKTK